MIWNRTAECMSRDEREQLQGRRLKETVRRCYEKVAFYRAKMDAAGIAPDDIRSAADINLLPFTTKEDLAESYPFGMFAAPMEDIVRIHSSSGTTGKPKVAGYTKSDIEVWAEVMARTLSAAGGGRKELIQNAYGYGLFTGGLGAHYGAEKIGATVIPISGGNTKRQIMIMQDFGSTLLSCTPSYALHLADTARDMGVDIRKLPLKYGVFGAEPWTESLRKEIESKMGIRATDIYGLTEIIGPGVAGECHEQNGLHVYDDHFLPEIIDPVTLLSVPAGTPGELVFTSLTKEAFPIIRYRTRDLSILNTDPCPCGRTHVRMGRITGRTDDMLIIRGVNVFPSQIESVLLEMDGTEPHYLIVVDKLNGMDVLEVWVEVSPKVFTDEIKGLEALEKKIRHEIHNVLGLTVSVKLVEPKTIERSEGKAKRVIDKRPKG
ncbi:MAG TPA: phenylacetate--CoA ligase [Armatimonadetes bacterium]|jgi:phenylacetate-CoA ligase|nr:phenylacetate--CoA ligase [Armatimonadota bacterium]